MPAAVLLLLCVPADYRDAWNKGEMSAAETKAFMKRLLRYVEQHHLKTDPKSPQYGMVYEYYDVKGKQWIQGEALDTMHDGAWLCAALATAYKVTGDEDYLKLLRRVLPFYCKMLNHSDTLFSAKRNDARKGGHTFNKEHALQEGEKGFVPYWWDDGASFSLERRRDRNPLGPFPCHDELAGKPNPEFRLKGHSLGSSNHLAQDLGVMLLVSWLVLRDSKDDASLVAELKEAARNLHECRRRHHGNIPMCLAPHALISGDAKLLAAASDGDSPRHRTSSNHYSRAVLTFEKGKRYPTPAFADDQQYHYYTALARFGAKLPEPIAFKVVYDAFTEPMLYRLYCDDEPAPPGINRFDLHTYYFKDGKPEDLRSDRKGPGKGPRPAGSRMGPQNMVTSGWALQLLAARPGLWDEKVRPAARTAEVVAALRRELGRGLRTWQAVFDETGYIPTAIGAGDWDRYSDSGGYAHLIAAGAQWLLVLEGTSDAALLRP
jgi:hypothetical protein